MRGRTLMVLLGALAVALIAVIGVLVLPMVEPTSLGAVRSRAARDTAVDRSSYDNSTGTQEIFLVAGATPAQIRAFWCGTVGHPAIVQGLPIDVYEGEYASVPGPPRDCGLVDDGVAKVTVIGGLGVLAAGLIAVLVMSRPAIVARMAGRTTRRGRAWMGAWSSALVALPIGIIGFALLLAAVDQLGSGLVHLGLLAAAFLPATLLTALITGALFGIRLARPQRVRGLWAYVAMAAIEVVLGAYLAAFGMAVLDSIGAREALGLGSMLAAGTIGLIVFGLPAFVATLAHVAVWRELLVEAVTGKRAPPTVVISPASSD